MLASFRTHRKPAGHAFQAILAALLSIPLLFAPSAIAAQSATTGAISGTVSDANGALLPGTVVVVTSVESGAVRRVKSNGKGEFRATELEPGTYTVTFTADGFEVDQEDQVRVLVGQVATLLPKLKVGSVTDKVEVQAGQGDLHVQSSEISTTIDQNAIDNLPINGRRFSNFALLTPGVTSNSDGFGLLSFRGISFLLNNNTVDGADDNQAYFSEARGRTRASYSVTQGAVQEFQVNTSNYSAAYGRAAGGVINTVTKSGGNQFHGELFFYDRDNSIGGAVNPYTLLTVPVGDGTYNTVPYKPTDRRLQFGFGMGGAIIRDKLFWFYAYDQEHRNFPGTARAPDPNDTFAPADATLPAGSTCTASSFTSAALNLRTEGDYNACAIAASFATTYQAGAAYYTQGLNVLSSYLGTVPRVHDQVVNFPKLDYQINDRERLSLLYNRMRSSSPNGVQTQTSNTYGIASFGDDFIKEDFGITRLTSVLSNSLVNEALVQYGRDFEYEYSDAPSPNERALANNRFNRPPEIGIGFNFSQGFTVGKGENFDRVALPDERRLQLLDGLTYSRGKQTFKVGLEFNKVSDYTNNLYDGNGNYSYDYSYDFIADYFHATEGIGPAGGYTPLYYGYGQAFGNPVGLITTREYAGYANDDWRLTPRLTLTLGVRYEYEYIPPNPFPNTGNPALVAAFAGTGVISDNAAVPLTSSRPDDRNNIAPRLGFALNVFGDGKTTLRGGYGLYYGRIINSNILQTYLESGAPNAQINFNSSSGNNASLYQPGHCGPTFPNLVNSASDVYDCFAGKASPLGTLTAAPQTPLSTVAYLDPHLQNPQVNELDLAVEQDLGHGMVLGVSYLGSFARELPHAVDTNFNLQNTYNYTFTIAPANATNITSYPISAKSTPTYSNYPQPPVSGYVTYPHGGATLPLKVGQQFTTKVFLQSLAAGAINKRPNPSYGQILDVRSDVNSSYNALAVQLNRRFAKGFSLLANYTWSHSLDYNPYQSTVVPTYNVFDPTNLKADYGNSNNDVRQRGVFAAVYQPQTHFRGYKNQALGGWRISPIVQIQTGLPYTPFVSGSVSGLYVPNGVDGCVTAAAAGCPVSPAYKGLNGSGSSADRLPAYERNTYNRPRTIVADLRLGKNFFVPVPHLSDRVRLEFLGEVFNLFNHQNITGVNTNAYQINGTNITPYTQAAGNGFGTYTNSDSNTTYSQRQVQLAARVHF